MNTDKAIKVSTSDLYQWFHALRRTGMVRCRIRYPGETLPEGYVVLAWSRDMFKEVRYLAVKGIGR